MLVRSMERSEEGTVFGPKPVRGLLVFAAALGSLLVAWSDASVADNARSAASDIAGKYGSSGKTLWFQGHWGFQYYIGSRGALPVDGKDLRMADGDLVAVPMNNANIFPVSPYKLRLVEEIDRQSLSWLATVKQGVGVGFYADVFGPLPFGVARIPPDKYYVFLVAKASP
jgi:hypothetical protein